MTKSLTPHPVADPRGQRHRLGPPHVGEHRVGIREVEHQLRIEGGGGVLHRGDRL